MTDSSSSVAPTVAAAPAGSVPINASPVLWSRRIGDDWLFAYTYLDAAGAPMTLGDAAKPLANLYAPFAIEPVQALTVGAGITILDAGAGTTLFKVPRAFTATLVPGFDDIGWPTRLAVQLLDADDNLHTLRVDALRVLHPRFELLQPAVAIAGNGTVNAQAAPDLVLPASSNAMPPFALVGVTTYVARHRFPYAPRVTIVDADGHEVDTDVAFAPGTVTLTFPAPFTGTLTLS